MLGKVMELFLVLACLTTASNVQEIELQVGEQVVENFEINLGYFLAICLLIFLIIA